MFREKIIITLLLIIISVVMMDTMLFMSLEGNSTIDQFQNPEISNNKKVPVNLSNNISSKPMNISEWKKDIFYDRSNIYDSWFELTGIIRFEGGHKAIINGEIVKKLDQIRGFKLKTITKNLVVLERHQYRVTLKLEE